MSLPPPEVVIVEDDLALRSSLAFVLEAEGFKVTSCDSAEALLALDLPVANACLIVDERLPGQGGVASLGVLRGRGVRLPAIVITSNPPPSLVLAAEAAGALVLEKPLLGDALSREVRARLALGAT